MSQFPGLSTVLRYTRMKLGEKPPSTDSDGDFIPDVHETLFEDWINWTTSDSRIVTIQGLDKSAEPMPTRTDRDGLNATEEYCWPFPPIVQP